MPKHNFALVTGLVSVAFLVFTLILVNSRTQQIEEPVYTPPKAAGNNLTFFLEPATGTNLTPNSNVAFNLKMTTDFVFNIANLRINIPRSAGVTPSTPVSTLSSTEGWAYPFIAYPTPATTDTHHRLNISLANNTPEGGLAGTYTIATFNLQTTNPTAAPFQITFDNLSAYAKSGAAATITALPQTYQVVTLVPTPGPFGKTYPGSNATNVPTSFTLSWTASPDATGYQYCLITANTGCTASDWISNGTATTKAISNLTAGIPYYWNVRVPNGTSYVYANGSQTNWMFTTAPLPTPTPGPFGKTYPGSNATNVPTSFTLSWTASPDATGYQYCLITANTGCTASDWISNGTATTKAISNLTAGIPYYWNVRVPNGTSYVYANGSQTNWMFTTAPLPTPTPGPFGKTYPGSNATNVPTSFTLSWTASPDATGYQYCLITANTGCTASDWISNGTATTKAISNLTAGIPYYWNVRVPNGTSYVYANGSQTNWMFTTQSASFNHTITVRYRLEGITKNLPNFTQVTAVKLFSGTTKVVDVTNASATNSNDPLSQGIFETTFNVTRNTLLTDGTYDAIINTPNHLRARYNGLTLDFNASNAVTIDLTVQPTALNKIIKAGDINSDDQITQDDIALIAAAFNGFKVTTPITSAVDINKDGAVTVTDMAIALVNYVDFIITGDPDAN